MAAPIRRLAMIFALGIAGCAAPPAPPGGVLPPSTAALDAHIPPFARWPYQPFSREAAVQIALREWRAFGQPVVFPNTDGLTGGIRLWQRQAAASPAAEALPDRAGCNADQASGFSA